MFLKVGWRPTKKLHVYMPTAACMSLSLRDLRLNIDFGNNW